MKDKTENRKDKIIMIKISKKFIKLICALLIISTFLCTAVSAESKIYTVVTGDTIWTISQEFEISLNELIKANPHISNPDYIEPGYRLMIPETATLVSLEDEVIRLVNAERDKYGLPALEKNWEVSRIARMKSQDMIDNKYFSHNSPTYGSPFNMLENFGLRFSSGAENIALGQRTASEVMKTWMESPGHRANILSRTVTHIGVGAAKSANGTLYWTQLFIKPY